VAVGIVVGVEDDVAVRIGVIVAARVSIGVGVDVNAVTG
jgi:hypothetical protein